MFMEGKITEIELEERKAMLTFIPTIPEMDDEFTVEMSRSLYDKMGKFVLGDEISFKIITDDDKIPKEEMSEGEEFTRSIAICMEFNYKSVPMEALSIKMFKKHWFEVKLVKWKNKDKH